MRSFTILALPALGASAHYGTGEKCSHITCEHIMHKGNCGGGRQFSLDMSSVHFQGEPCVAHGVSSIRVSHTCSGGPKTWGGRDCAETVCAGGHFCGMNGNSCECVKLTTTKPRAVSALTCSELGWVRKAGPKGNEVCGASRCRNTLAVQAGGGNIDYGKADLAEATSECKKFGARLCTKDELKAKETQGTGCSQDGMWIWSSTSCGNGKTYVVMGNGSGTAQCKTNTDDSHHIRCCADEFTPTVKSTASCAQLGWKEIHGDPGTCGASKCRGVLAVQDGGGSVKAATDQGNAQAICYNNGARLCTAAELLNREAAGTGCSHDGRGVWSSSTCDNDATKFWVVTKGSTGAGTKTCEAESASTNHVRCCADAVIPGSASSKTCAQLGWNEVNGKGNGVCGASRCRNTLAVQAGGGNIDYGKATHAEASGQCTAYGARLCTKDEIVNQDTTGTGCSHDLRKIWTASPCGHQPNMHWVLNGNGSGDPTCVADSDDSHHIRCCADS